MVQIKILFLLLCLFLSTPARAQSGYSQDYATWLAGLEQEAVANGVSSRTVHAALDNVMLDDHVIELDHRQPERTISFARYARLVVTAARVREGRSLYRENAAELKSIARQFGVQPQVIVALWAIESGFGRHMGDYKVVDSLATLAYEGRRAAFFRGELMAALHILDQEKISSDSLRGSWAGAMGQCQFMPTTYLKYAYDQDKDGKRDIWDNESDVWASIASYLSAEGWSDTQTWGREVKLTKKISGKMIGLDHRASLGKWSSLGVRSLGGKPLPATKLQASLVIPDGQRGRAFLVYDNFRALMRWNHSTYFATTVGLLADRIK